MHLEVRRDFDERHGGRQAEYWRESGRGMRGTCLGSWFLVQRYIGYIR